MRMNWDKLLDLVDRTREKIFFFNGSRPYVIMSLEEYERLVAVHDTTTSLSETEMLNKINRDIAVWKAKSSDQEMQERAESMAQEQELETEDDEFHIEPVEV